MDLGVRLDVVERLSRLLEEGALTEAEFEATKSRVLSRSAVADGSNLQAWPEDGSRGYGYQSEGPPKWLIGAFVLVVLGTAFFFFLVPNAVETNSPSVAANSPAPSSAAPQPTSGQTEADSKLDEAAAALEATGASVEAAVDASTPEQNQEVGRTEREVLSSKQARCRVKVPGQVPIVGPCTFNTFSDTEFEVKSPSSSYTAQVVQTGEQHEGLVIDSAGARIYVGPLTQEGACWRNAEVEICAWAV